ncbi:unnamed protein product [Kuraishia capsulata CBS 1993]|uniref:tRNA-dihydrouridine(16/17) synthase [NAD(P)(+)] n=1 Tax=Kuraishia capsulata CBS 1993 TaxID=1382522 RepID=W6MNX7_9ASCO|nr:uncharacterized protein KUCA_T00004313001 [Kuraishia capsulata CBS 1993]CDK28331.1 unnamed protein product [Kuraishia capsulata CBS 1993]
MAPVREMGTEAPTKLAGPELYEKLGRPHKIVAPMVDQSELAWRILSRRYGADLAYTPMYHARLFATEQHYRDANFGPLDGDAACDRPLVVQFCANDPEYLLQAAKFVENRCDAVDLNLGCPQGIARKGHYGSFLMEDWDLVRSLIAKLHAELAIPVTAKIRVYDDWERSLEYARIVLDAGAQFITIHGRTREMKGQKTGIADWKLLKYLRDNLPKDQVFFANGNILYPEDIGRCIDQVGCDGVMSAEGNLHNPGVFWTETDEKDKQFPRIDKISREYFEILKTTPGEASRVAFKSHMFKMLRNFLPHHTDIRDKLARVTKHHTLDQIETEIIEEIERTVEKVCEESKDVVVTGEVEEWGGAYKQIPYWRCQPYFRRVDGKSGQQVVSNLIQDRKRKAENIDAEQPDPEAPKAARLEEPGYRAATDSAKTAA